MQLFECHITVRLQDAEPAGRIASENGWKTSEIARDPVLGNASWFYLTSHGSTYESIYRRMCACELALEAVGLTVVRSKIEQILHDTKTGIYQGRQE